MTKRNPRAGIYYRMARFEQYNLHPGRNRHYQSGRQRDPWHKVSLKKIWTSLNKSLLALLTLLENNRKDKSLCFFVSFQTMNMRN